jgi:hypothetical protein
LKKKDLIFIEELLREFEYDINLNTSKIQPDDLVKNNNKLIEQNKEIYFKTGMNISEHLKNLQKKNPRMHKINITANIY